jgi:hypothetical protein
MTVQAALLLLVARQVAGSCGCVPRGLCSPGLAPPPTFLRCSAPWQPCCLPGSQASQDTASAPFFPVSRKQTNTESLKAGTHHAWRPPLHTAASSKEKVQLEFSQHAALIFYLMCQDRIIA